MDSICEVVAQLLDYLADLLVFLVGTCFANKSFESCKVSLPNSDASSGSDLLKCSLFSFVIEFVRQEALN
jgi:hypothetical protein